MGSEEEIDEAIQIVREEGCDQILIFHCISSYPTPTELSNLNTIKFLKENIIPKLVYLITHLIIFHQLLLLQWVPVR